MSFIYDWSEPREDRDFKYIFFSDPSLFRGRDVSSTHCSEQARARLGIPWGCGSYLILNYSSNAAAAAVGVAAAAAAAAAREQEEQQRQGRRGV